MSALLRSRSGIYVQRFQTPSQSPDDASEYAHKASICKDQPSWPISVSNCIYATYDFGNYLHRIR
jgi:hypothetical protein